MFDRECGKLGVCNEVAADIQLVDQLSEDVSGSLRRFRDPAVGRHQPVRDMEGAERAVDRIEQTRRQGGGRRMRARARAKECQEVREGDVHGEGRLEGRVRVQMSASGRVTHSRILMQGPSFPD